MFYDEKNTARLDDFSFVGSIGRERYQMSEDRCAGEDADWKQITTLQKRDLYERHIRRFDLCPHGTAELARRSLADASVELGRSDRSRRVRTDKSVNECDALAASPLDMDRARPPGTGVTTENLDAEAAIKACNKAVADFPRIARYLYNLGRAYQKLALRPGMGDDERRRALDSARLAYDDAANRRGYISALNDLAVLDEMDDRTADALDLFRRGAQQGHPLAMYNLALHYRDGIGLLRDDGQASEWFARAAGAGLVSAMVEYGRMLDRGSGQPDSKPNRRRAIEWLQRAADSGSLRAMYYLGRIYDHGQGRDLLLALLWYGRAAEAGYSDAQVRVAQIVEKGEGLANPQPEIAERYWRFAANHGDPFAQVQFADKLRSGLLLVKEEYGQGEVVTC